MVNNNTKQLTKRAADCNELLQFFSPLRVRQLEHDRSVWFNIWYGVASICCTDVLVLPQIANVDLLARVDTGLSPACAVALNINCFCAVVIEEQQSPAVVKLAAPNFSRVSRITSGSEPRNHY